MSKGIIYYTSNRIPEPICSVVRKYILESGLPIVSCSLEPIDFGDNIVLPLRPSYLTYMSQIMTCLTKSEVDHVFFCEHDVLYPSGHFDFTPPRDDVFYYNANVWRWLYRSNTAITYDRLISLSSLCVNRMFALNHYQKRWDAILKAGLENFTKPEPDLARKWGYEPGAKKTRRGGFSDDVFDTWQSDIPIVDIRHEGTMSKAKVTLDSFKHLPKNWREIAVDDVPGWNLREMFKVV